MNGDGRTPSEVEGLGLEILPISSENELVIARAPAKSGSLAVTRVI